MQIKIESFLSKVTCIALTGNTSSHHITSHDFNVKFVLCAALNGSQLAKMKKYIPYMSMT